MAEPVSIACSSSLKSHARVVSPGRRGSITKALFVFLVVPGDPGSGAFYVYDRRAQVWYWLDFDDEKFGGYTVGDFDRLVRDWRFLDLIERPQLLTGRESWIVTPGSRPQQSRDATAATIAKLA